MGIEITLVPYDFIIKEIKQKMLGINIFIGKDVHSVTSWRHMVHQSNFSNDDLDGDHNVVSTQVPQADWHSGGTWI